MLRVSLREHYSAPVATTEREEALLLHLGQRVREARKRRALTARQLAERAGLSARFVSQLETGKANIAVGRLARVADVLGVALGALLDGHVEEGRPGRLPRATRVVALLGLRGAGKSSIGPRIAESLERSFYELDALVEAEAGLSLSTVFAVHGEAYYRRLEHACLRALIDRGEPLVVALSGGVVHNAPAFGIVQSECLSVWLKAAPEDHMRRVREQGDHRPMANRSNAMSELRAILLERAPLYRQADVIVDTSIADLDNASRVVTEQLRVRFPELLIPG